MPLFIGNGKLTPRCRPTGGNRLLINKAKFCSVHLCAQRGLDEVFTRVLMDSASWERMAPLIIGRPAQKGSTGRDNRMFMEGVLRTYGLPQA